MSDRPVHESDNKIFATSYESWFEYTTLDNLESYEEKNIKVLQIYFVPDGGIVVELFKTV